MQEHYSDIDLFVRVRNTTHSTELLHSEEPIAQLGSIALKLIWFVYLHFGPSYGPWTSSWLLLLVR